MFVLLRKIIKKFLTKLNLYFLIFLFKLIRDYFKSLKKPFILNSEFHNSFKYIGNSNIKDNNYEIEVKKLFLKLIQQTDNFINVGANYGFYCCLALSKNINTIAFEPVYTNLRVLYKNIKINNFDENIQVFPLALSDKSEFKEIYGMSETASLAKGWMQENISHEIVYCSTMDQVLNASNFEDKQTLILIDVEGFENKVIKGSSSFMKLKTKPFWIIEIIYDLYGVNNNDYEAIFDFFFDNDYLCFDIHSDLKQILHEDLHKKNSSNFLFIDKEKIKLIDK